MCNDEHKEETVYLYDHITNGINQNRLKVCAISMLKQNVGVVPVVTFRNNDNLDKQQELYDNCQLKLMKPKPSLVKEHFITNHNEKERKLYALHSNNAAKFDGLQIMKLIKVDFIPWFGISSIQMVLYQNFPDILKRIDQKFSFFFNKN